MFGDSRIRNFAGSLGQMTRTLGQDFVGLTRGQLLERMPNVWHGASVNARETEVVITHEAIPSFSFIFQTGNTENALIEYLVAQGSGPFDGLSIIADQQSAIATGSKGGGIRLTGDIKKLLKYLEKDYGIPFSAETSHKQKAAIRKDNVGNVVATATTASIIMALADGEFAQEERDRLVETIGAFKKGYASPREILSMIEEHVAAVKKAGPDQWPGVMRQMATGMSLESKKLILHGAGNIALVDGKFTEEEQKMIASMAQWIELSENEFHEWFKEFNVTINEEIIRGNLKS